MNKDHILGSSRPHSQSTFVQYLNASTSPGYGVLPHLCYMQLIIMSPHLGVDLLHCGKTVCATSVYVCLVIEGTVLAHFA